MYRIATPANDPANKGLGQVATPVAHPKYLASHPKWAAFSTAHPQFAQALREAYARRQPKSGGMSGCGCAGCGCSGGVGQAESLSQVASDFSTVLTDVFLNADGSLNMAAVAFAGFGAILIYVNWGNTTKKRFSKK